MLTMDKLVALAKRRGFIFPSSEIYGGLSSSWDYGPLGVELKNNIAAAWWNLMVRQHQDVVGLDSAIMMHPRVWEASGHVENFHDPLVDCKACKSRFRADHIDLTQACPSCGKKDQFTAIRQFNLMFSTRLGSVEENSLPLYLRPETAQGIFVNFKNVLDTMRVKVPFGIAQIGKAFRNEITTKNFIFRTCEFEQMEMQFFVAPDTDKEWFEFWKNRRWHFYESLGVHMKRLRFQEHGPQELAHYARQAFDIEYEFPFGWAELEGIHNRGDYDLSRHMEFCGKNVFEYHDLVLEKRYTPCVIETSAGLTRSVLMFLSDAYHEEILEDGSQRVVLRLHPRLAPYKAALLPLMKKDGLAEWAFRLYQDLCQDFALSYDETAAIGRRYRRQDEIGTPFCLTVDHQTLEDGTLTWRYRDSMQQKRVNHRALRDLLQEEIRQYSRPTL